jgi:putative transposase
VRHSKVEIYLHMVWATREREPLLNSEITQTVYRAVRGEATKLKCEVLSIGGIPDHVHLLVRVPSTVCAAELANKVKGVSSRLVNQQHTKMHYFCWQDGYGAFSISQEHIPAVRDYIKNQELHHKMGTTIPEWEQTNEESVSK